MTLADTPTTHGKRADIQGMRAIAVLAVLAFHASHALLPGGFAVLNNKLYIIAQAWNPGDFAIFEQVVN